MMKAFLTKKMVGSVIRHAMTAIGGVVVAGGYADEATWQTITGGAVAAGGLVLSLTEKRLLFNFQ